MVNEGRLAPVVDVVQALRDEAAGGGNNGKGGSGKGGGAADDIAKASGNKSKKDVSGEGITMKCLEFCFVEMNVLKRTSTAAGTM